MGYLEQHGYSKTNKEFGKIESLTFKKKTNIPLSPLKFWEGTMKNPTTKIHIPRFKIKFKNSKSKSKFPNFLQNSI